MPALHGWGEDRYKEGAGLTDNRYTGQLEQAELGLYYYVARWYDPAIAHFAQADTIVPSPGKPVAWDRYGYVAYNPIRYMDPSGHRFCEDVDCNHSPIKPLPKNVNEGIIFIQCGNQAWTRTEKSNVLKESYIVVKYKSLSEAKILFQYQVLGERYGKGDRYFGNPTILRTALIEAS